MDNHYRPDRSSSSLSQPFGKSEVIDLKLQLHNLAESQALGSDDAKRELFKKIISLMTISIDISATFSEMVICSATFNIILKKMCYLYVGNYACGNPNIAWITINFLQKDCKDEDPMIRGSGVEEHVLIEGGELGGVSRKPTDGGVGGWKWVREDSCHDQGAEAVPDLTRKLLGFGFSSHVEGTHVE